MGPRQNVGRRFIDRRPDAPTPSYPIELERRRRARREGDRAPVDTRTGRRKPLLFSAHWHCAWCGHELHSRCNVPNGKRRFIVVEPPQGCGCDCRDSRLSGASIVLNWRFQGNDET